VYKLGAEDLLNYKKLSIIATFFFFMSPPYIAFEVFFTVGSVVVFQISKNYMEKHFSND
jgi:hypothetical protein